MSENNSVNNQIKISDKEIIEKYSNTEKYAIKKNKFYKYINKLGNKTGFEGVWISEPYTIGIIKDVTNPDREYVGFIVASQSPYWQENQVKLEIFKTNKGTYRMKYYMRDHSVLEFNDIMLYDDNYLNAGFIHLKKTLPKTAAKKNIERFIKAIETRKPFIEKISENTVLLRIPSFRMLNKKYIDSLLNASNKMIISTKNFIIDLRNNGGGSDASYNKLLPYLYTNPIRVIGATFLSTKQNNSRMAGYLNLPDISENNKKEIKKSLEKLNNHLGEFVNLNDNIVNTITLKSVYANPKNIAILVNNNCGSTTEQFLLAAKQSKKVKLYGITTLGSLDISNMYYIISPSKEFKLWYGLTKSNRIPDMLIDGKGIQPDYYYDKTIKPYEWIDKTIEILDGHSNKKP